MFQLAVDAEAESAQPDLLVSAQATAAACAMENRVSIRRPTHDTQVCINHWPC